MIVIQTSVPMLGSGGKKTRVFSGTNIFNMSALCGICEATRIPMIAHMNGCMVGRLIKNIKLLNYKMKLH